MRPESHTLARVANGAIGALVGVYAFLDDLLLGPILVAATVWVPWYLVFGVAASVAFVRGRSEPESQPGDRFGESLHLL